MEQPLERVKMMKGGKASLQQMLWKMLWKEAQEMGGVLNEGHMFLQENLTMKLWPRS